MGNYKYSIILVLFLFLCITFIFKDVHVNKENNNSFRYDSLNTIRIELENNLKKEKNRIDSFQLKFDSLNKTKTIILKQYVIRYKKIDSLSPNKLCIEFEGIFSKHSIK